MSSSSSITTTTVNGRSVISGLSSGIDVDSIVEQLMTSQSTKLNKLKQQQQLAEWKQEAYRDIVDDIKTFAGKYFDTTSASSIMSEKTFQQYAVTSSSSAVTASYTSAASAGSHTVTVSQLATAAALKTSGTFTKAITGSGAIDYEALSGTSFVITLDGTATTVTLDDSVTDLESLQAAVDDAVGSGKVTLTESDEGILGIAATTDSGVQKITISNSGSGSALSALGFSATTLSNRISTSATLETLADSMSDSFSFNDAGAIELSINGVSFTFDKSTTLAALISEVNASDAGVTMKYDELSDKLVLQSNTTGAQKSLTVTESGSTFLSAALGQSVAGTDAKATIDGVTLTRSSNTVTIDGVTYTFNATTDSKATVSLTQDADAIYESIASFVEDYNTLISTINSMLSEQYDSDYPPLTEAQEAEMSETEIENWNEKAKTGLLAKDSLLQSLLDDLRNALVDTVSGSSLTLASIGITTGSYNEKGKLYIDEDTLKEAIQSDSQSILKLFTQTSTDYSGTASKYRKLSSGEKAVRYQQEGIAYRFYDFIQDNISTLKDSSGNKGLLLEKAGMENDTTNTDNTLTDKINDYKERIDKEEDRLDEVEERLYAKYTAMETYISQLNSQLTALSSYLSTSSS